MTIDWSTVKRVLVIRLRSIGDTVLATPSLGALKRFLPDAEIDVLLEKWVAPLLEGSEDINDVLSIGRTSGDRLKTAAKLRRRGYDVVFNLHGGTTATLLAFATGARHRVGLGTYQYSFLYNHVLGSAYEFWGRKPLHSAEQQLALLGHVGVPVEHLPKSGLPVLPTAIASLNEKWNAAATESKTTAVVPNSGVFALIHPAAAFDTKQWPARNFALVIEHLHSKGILSVAVAAPNETAVLESLSELTRAPLLTFNDLSLPEITALASKARIFVGNDSGIAHIAAAVGTPTAVIFGSSNRDHWRPWTEAPSDIIFREFACQPCPGYSCGTFGEPRCILEVPVDDVIAAVDRLLNKKSGPDGPAR
jgi:ADP-heptose:LPS heptosyltransferase